MKVFTGVVIHTNMQKTAKVEVVRTMAHPLYGKRVKKTKRYLVHDEFGTKPGDSVRFSDTKPVSKMKKWKIIEVLSQKAQKERKARK